MSKKMNHAEYQKSLRKRTEAQLRFIMKDAAEAAEAVKELNPESAGYYLDEVSYAAMELKRRGLTA